MIYKYNLGVPYLYGQGKFNMLIRGAEIKKVLDIQLQGASAVLWAEVELVDYDTELQYEIVWTGFEEPKDFIYIATIQEPDTGLVYHYYIPPTVSYLRDIH